MKYIDTSDFKLKNSAVCLGKFDGMHVGHRELVEAAKALREDGCFSVIFTFSVNPRLVFGDGEFTQIYTEAEKRRLLKEMGCDVLVTYPFEKEMFSMEPLDFIERILIDKLDTKAIFVGDDLRFGHKRSGDVNCLKEASKGRYVVKTFEKVKYHGQIVSSTRIRESIKLGNLEAANAMLGGPYSIIGEVLHGRALGRTLGMPTANMVPDDTKLLPPNGVYASRTWHNNNVYYGISNIGVKPTVGAEEKRLIETFLFDYSGDLYGEILKVELFSYSRPEQKFASIQELKQQMMRDTLFARQYFNTFFEC